MQLSQLPLVQIVKFQCLSNREFPEFFKTHPTYISRSILKGSRSLQTKTGHFYFPRLYSPLSWIALPYLFRKKSCMVMTKLDQSSEKTKKNGVSAKIKKFTRVVLQTVKGRWTLWRLSSSRLRRTPIARVLTLMKYIKQPRGQTVQVKSDHEDGPIIWWLKLVNI